MIHSASIHKPLPKFPKSDAFPNVLEQIIDNYLAKDPKERKSPLELYVVTCLQCSSRVY